MTWSMPDSTVVADLPPGFPAYLGYADGALIPATCGELAARFPGARRVCLTTTGQTLAADGCDIETGDLTPEGGVVWAQRKLIAAPASRPVLYASVSAMADVLIILGEVGIRRDQVRLLSAHWGWLGPLGRSAISPPGKHICGPSSCGEIGVPMDGTQWTDQYPGLNGSRVDMSLLGDGFFGQPTWTERLVQQLPVVREGDTGEAVKTVQGLCTARGYGLVTDGVFGFKTLTAVRTIQHVAGVAVDGVVGEQTWPVLLGIA